ncbi:HNH endonuclease domain-containing protein [Leucothrix arctica]|uniref:HNH nuclease domain-containing protein n=1 Tax=Leucothrix arctica TaxID=1481894 RepID=A0A317CFA0_9GAMM|nr:HNH endonuclease domain-containing protein [Leucothrix arctica]PWQ97304.1 hypothetical protein DKT75_07125 [Leucothrix arctica]
MSSYSPQLPQHSKLDVAALSRLFKSTSTSYKFLFFLAILNTLQSTHRKEGEPVRFALEDLAVEMALLSWYPIQFYKLSFGWQDQVAKIISQLQFDPSFKAITSTRGQTQLRAAIKEQAKDIGLYSLLRFVPYRLLSPFYSAELSGIPEKRKNDAIADLASQYNTQTIPLYSFVQDQDQACIQIHPEWVNYLLQAGNITIVKDWTLMGWISYLQKRNPNTPAIINKVLPPIKRSSLSSQTSFWKKIIEADAGQDLRCIYSNEPLLNQSFSLDHFLPWTFICHDQIWNLCPVTPSSNSSKGNKLPADDYVEKFIQQQIQALEVSSKVMSAKSWDKITESYAMDLRLDPKLLLDENAVRDAYTGVLMPMMTLAKTSGFEASWLYKNEPHSSENNI